MTKTLRFHVRLQCLARPSRTSSTWIGECPTMGIVVSSKNLDQLRTDFAESLDLLITDLIEDGELEEFLLSKGIYPEPDYSSWLELAQQEGSLTLPWRLVADSDLDLRVA